MLGSACSRCFAAEWFISAVMFDCRCPLKRQPCWTAIPRHNARIMHHPSQTNPGTSDGAALLPHLRDAACCVQDSSVPANQTVVSDLLVKQCIGMLVSLLLESKPPTPMLFHCDAPAHVFFAGHRHCPLTHTSMRVHRASGSSSR